MPKYFFNLHGDIEAIDEEGLELLDIEAAQMVARHNARFSAAAMRKTGGMVSDHRIEVVDDQGNVLDTVYFRDAVDEL